jgi:TfoX/Sxy family transcriptional regulator of competence genes
MAANEKLVERVAAALAGKRTERKKMFGGICFMVRGKMCVTVGADRIMVRIDPEDHDAAIARPGASTMVMKGREYRGYVRVAESAIKTKPQLDRWVRMALEYNKRLA